LRDEVVLIIPAGRWENLSILLPHLLKVKDLFTRIELWMNACWEREDEHYIRRLINQYPGTFLLKDDGMWGVIGRFQHYGRYYKTLGQDDTMYIKIDDDILWMEPNAIKNLIDTRRGNPDPLLIVGNIVNNAYCNFKHQCLGVYDKTWDLEGFRAKDNYNGEFSEFAHNTLLNHIKRGTWDRVYRFPDDRVHGFRLPNHVYAVYGKDITWSIDDEAAPTEGAASAERPVLVTGNSIFAHYAYGEQIGHMNLTDIRARYKKEIPHEG